MSDNKLIELVKLWREKENRPFEETFYGLKFETADGSIFELFASPVNIGGKLWWGCLRRKDGESGGINYLSTDGAQHLYENIEQKLGLK